MKPTKDRTKLNAVWLPADVMRDKHHERECTYSRVIHYDDGSAEVDATCICDRLRLCKSRALDAARNAVAALENADLEIDWDRDYAADPTGSTRNPRLWLRDVLAAIDALRGQPADQTGYKPPDAP